MKNQSEANNRSICLNTFVYKKTNEFKQMSWTSMRDTGIDKLIKAILFCTILLFKMNDRASRMSMDGHIGIVYFKAKALNQGQNNANLENRIDCTSENK